MTTQFSNLRYGCRTFCAGSTSRAGVGLFKIKMSYTIESTGKPSIPAAMVIDASESLLIRFWSKVAKAGPDDCWLWTGMKTKKGYGRIKIDNKTVFAHRLSFTINNGQLKRGECARHTCDNPPCVNPKHLLKGSRIDNRADCVARNRQAVGVDAGRSKLTPEAVAYIRDNYVFRKTPFRIFAEKYGTGINAIASIVYGETWRHQK